MPSPAADPMPQVRLAVITPVHNRHAIAYASAASVVAELRPADDFVIADDGSTPPLATTPPFPDLGPRVRILRHEANMGVLAARNTLLREVRADADWVLFLDSDDRLLPGWRGTVDRAVADDVAASLLWFDRVNEEDGSLAGYMLRPGDDITVDDVMAGRVSGNFVPMVRREFLEGFAFDERGWGWEGVLFVSILGRAPGRHVAVPLAIGPRAGQRADSASASQANYAPARARGLALGAEAYIAELSPRLQEEYPDHFRDLLLTALTWRVIAGDATVSKALRARSDLRGATRRQRLRWASLVTAAALPDRIRRSLLHRRARIGASREARHTAAPD